MDAKPTIEVRENGPYLVRGLIELKDAGGAQIPCKPEGGGFRRTRPVLALCRCGGSASKPFCDGSHQQNGFSGARLADPAADRRTSARGRGITIHDNRAICAHAGICTDSLAAVFRSGEEPWIDPAGAAVESVIATIRACPSGALSYTIDQVENRNQERSPAITVTRGGPYAVVGGIELRDAAWCQGASTEHYTLCRCGGSKNKPFCDGSHWENGFSDREP